MHSLVSLKPQNKISMRFRWPSPWGCLSSWEPWRQFQVCLAFGSIWYDLCFANMAWKCLHERGRWLWVWVFSLKVRQALAWVWPGRAVWSGWEQFLFLWDLDKCYGPFPANCPFLSHGLKAPAGLQKLFRSANSSRRCSGVLALLFDIPSFHYLPQPANTNILKFARK